MVTASLQRSLLVGSVLLALHSSPASAQVTDWFIYKEQIYSQTADNTPAPAPFEFWSGSIVETANAGDASSVTLSGGGIAGNMPLAYDSDEGAWLLELDFANKAAMDAFMPNSTVYTLTLSGGTLGTLVQTAAMGPEQYPATPYLTGGTWSQMLSYPSASPVSINWSDPGPQAAASGATWFDIEDVQGDLPFAQNTVGVALSALVPANTLGSTHPYLGYLSFAISRTTSSGAFGVPGQSHQAVSLQFDIESSVTNYCVAGTSASGCVAALSATGLPSASAGAGFTVSALGMEGNKDGLFFVGTGGRQANAWGNGSSFQCVIPPVKRFGLLATNGTNGACNGSKSQDFNSHWNTFPSKNPGSGTVVQAQLWYRDPFNTSNRTTSLSDAIEFTVNP